MKNFLLSIALVSGIIFLTAFTSYSQYKVDRFVWGQGGGTVLGTSNRINGTVGQLFLGSSESSLNKVNAGFWYTYSQITGIEESELLPTEYRLYQNYPNPFNPVTRIRYELPEESSVTMRIYNSLGEEVAMLVNKVLQAGRYELDWNAAGYASGFYICRIEAGTYISVKKLILLK